MRVTLSPGAAKFLKRCNEETYRRVRAKLDALSFEPFPSDAKRVQGREEKLFRVRIGDYRILYTVFPDELFVADIDKRDRVYD